MVVAAAFLTLLATSTLQTLTPEKLNAETAPQVSGLRWLDNVHIVGNVKVGKETTQRSWSVTSGAATVVALGESRSSPDGTRIVTLESEEWIVREIAGARRALARVPADYGKNQLGLIVWSRDSQKLALAQVSRAKPEPPDTVSLAETVRYVDVGVQADARDTAGMFTTTITILDLNEPESPRRFPYAGRLQALEWGAADDLYFVTQRFWNTDGEPIETVVRAIEGGATRDVFRVGGIMQTIEPRISPDGRWLSVTCDIDSQVWDDFNSLLLVELATGKVRRLTHDKYVSGPSVHWSPDSQRLYYLTRDGGWTQAHSSDLEGRSVALTDSPTLKEQLQVSPDGQRLAYVASDGSARMEIRSRATKSNRDTRVALLNDPGTRFRLGRFERAKFPNGEGVQLAAWMIYPPDFDPSRKYPLFVDVHGGGPGSFLYLSAPLSMVTARGPLEWHTWASKGYVVFVPDYRSSGEYGPGIASARHRNGDFGGIEADTRDVEAGIEWISGRPYIDATRIGVFGASAGGARVNLLLTRNTRYRAAAIHDEIGAGVLPEFLNSLTGARTGSLGSLAYWQARVGNLAERPKDFLGGFLFDGYKSKTPTLILVGGDRTQEEMAATDPMSAEVLFSILRQSHVPARMLRYLDDGHGFQTPASATHAFEQVDAWFVEHMDMAIDAHGAIQFDGGRVRSR